MSHAKVLVAAQAVESLERFHHRMEQWVEVNGNLPADTSLARQELAQFPNSKCVENVHTQGAVMLEFTAEHVVLFIKSLSTPLQTIAPWTATRSLLESSALGVWLFDHQLSAQERIQRGFMLRYHGMDQQLKIARARKDKRLEQTLKDRMDKVVSDAQAFNIPPALDRNGYCIGIGKLMPTITDLVGNALKCEIDYRILSMMAHCQLPALQQLGFQVSTCNETGALHLDKQIQPEHVFYLCNLAFTSYTKQLWCLANLFGLNVLRLEEAIEDAADELEINVAERFWRAQQVPT